MRLFTGSIPKLNISYLFPFFRFHSTVPSIFPLFTSMCLTTMMGTCLAVWQTLAGLQVTVTASMGPWLTGEPQSCLRALLFTLTQVGTSAPYECIRLVYWTIQSTKATFQFVINMPNEFFFCCNGIIPITFNVITCSLVGMSM